MFPATQYRKPSIYLKYQTIVRASSGLFDGLSLKKISFFDINAKPWLCVWHEFCWKFELLLLSFADMSDDHCWHVCISMRYTSPTFFETVVFVWSIIKMTETIGSCLRCVLFIHHYHPNGAAIWRHFSMTEVENWWLPFCQFDCSASLSRFNFMYLSYKSRAYCGVACASIPLVSMLVWCWMYYFHVNCEHGDGVLAYAAGFLASDSSNHPVSGFLLLSLLPNCVHQWYCLDAILIFICTNYNSSDHYYRLSLTSTPVIKLRHTAAMWVLSPSSDSPESTTISYKYFPSS